jgi:hypothetical protein
MRVRVGQAFAALSLVLACGRSQLELAGADAPGAGAGGASLASGAGGTPGGGAGGGTGGSIRGCDLAFSANGPIGDGVSTFASVSASFVCVTPGEVDPQTISVVLGSALGSAGGVVTWDGAEGRLSFTPSEPLALATEYTATASLPGAELIWSFRTTDGTWLPEEEVGTGGDIALAVSPDGHGLVGFRSGIGVRVRRFTLDSGLAESDELVNDGPIAPLRLRLGVASGGDAVVVWGSEPPTRGIHARRGALDQPFDAVRRIGLPAASEFLEDLMVAGDGTGLLLTSVRRGFTAPGTLYATSLGPDFGTPTPLGDTMPLDTVRALARSGGRSWAVWSSWLQTGRVIGRHADEPGGFGAPIVVREPAARAGFAAMARDGSALVIWEEGSPLDSVKAARVTPAGEVESPSVLDTSVPGAASSGVYARVAVDDLGRGMALWVNQGETAQGTLEQIRAQRYDGAWAPEPMLLSASTIGEWAVLSPTALALDPHGNGFAGLGQGAPARARMVRFLESVGWLPSIELAASATAPLVAVDASGRAAVAWASEGKVFLRRFIELTAPHPRH